MRKITFDLLTIDQINGKNKLSIFDNTNIQCENTYFSQILGASSSKTLITKTLYSEDRNYLVKAIISGKECYSDVYSTDTMIRPITKFSNIKDLVKNKVINEQGITEIEFGEFPTSEVSKNIYNILEIQYQNGLLHKSNQTFTTFTSYNRYDFNLEQSPNAVFVYNSEKYIRLIGRYNSYNSNYSNSILWIKVCPIKWLVDEKNDIAITKDSIFSGIPFNDNRNYNNNFEETLLYRYLNNIFIKEISYGINIDLNNIEEDIIKKLKKKEIDTTEKIESVLKYVLLCYKLKELIRKGWKDYNINSERLESVAEHVFGTLMVAIAMKTVFKYKVNLSRVLFMLAIHEVGESIIGDITYREMTREEKNRIEREAVHKIFDDLIGGSTIEQLFLEFDLELTEDAKFAKWCDKLDADIMAKYYEENNAFNFDQMNDFPVLKDLYNSGLTMSQSFIEHDSKESKYDNNFKAVTDYLQNNNIKELILKKDN